MLDQINDLLNILAYKRYQIKISRCNINHKLTNLSKWAEYPGENGKFCSLYIINLFHMYFTPGRRFEFHPSETWRHLRGEAVDRIRNMEHGTWNMEHGTWNMEHFGTLRNIPEHPGTSNNYDYYTLYSPSVFSLAESLQLILGNSATYTLFPNLYLQINE